ncbi:MAG TPA: T9SS type A sorting domain-containing protein [bacterium]|nr:T9SS type A sorting domain-containing protein [bacterium]
MKHNKIIPAVIGVFVLFADPSLAQGRNYPIIANHLCTDIGQIPPESIDKVKDSIKVYYGHASHGGQITGGLEILAQKDTRLAFAQNDYLPNVPNALCFQDVGNDPEQFFATVQSKLDQNPSIDVAMFGWCGEAAWYDVNHYIQQMQALEQRNPEVTFIYMTGNAQEGELAGYNRHVFNQALRQYCQANNRVLFDFADLDCWYNGEYTPARYDWDDWGRLPLITGIPLEHPHYHGDELGHTTLESCENKAKAAWWMFAQLVGWTAFVPVEMGTFKASANNGSVELEWSTISESNNYGFLVERSQDNIRFAQIGFIGGHGTTAALHNYRFIDRAVAVGERYYYRLKQLDQSGQFNYSSTVEMFIYSPAGFDLRQNYPNPFNANTIIHFHLGERCWIDLSIFNSRGQQVATLISGMVTAGFHTEKWQSAEQRSGVYFARLLVRDRQGKIQQQIKKMALLN